MLHACIGEAEKTRKGLALKYVLWYIQYSFANMNIFTFETENFKK